MKAIYFLSVLLVLSLLSCSSSNSSNGREIEASNPLDNSADYAFRKGYHDGKSAANWLNKSSRDK